MRWIHLSDIHFNPNGAGFQTNFLRDTLPAYLARVVTEPLDLLFLTGDFRYGKTQPDTGKLAKDVVQYLRKIMESTGIDSADNVHMVPGNHDLTRTAVRSALIQQIDGTYREDDGFFDPEILTSLQRDFPFFNRVQRELGQSPLAKKGLPHALRQFDGYNILYLNSAVTAGRDGEEGHLALGTGYVQKLLQSMRQPGTVPTFCLAHHGLRMLRTNEYKSLCNLFRDYNITLYLCGHEHSLWYEKINDIHQMTVGCMLQADGVQAGFLLGEYDAEDHTVVLDAHTWDRVSGRWGSYAQFERQGERLPLAYRGRGSAQGESGERADGDEIPDFREQMLHRLDSDLWNKKEKGDRQEGQPGGKEERNPLAEFYIEQLEAVAEKKKSTDKEKSDSGCMDFNGFWKLSGVLAADTGEEYVRGKHFTIPAAKGEYIRAFSVSTVYDVERRVRWCCPEPIVSILKEIDANRRQYIFYVEERMLDSHLLFVHCFPNQDMVLVNNGILSGSHLRITKTPTIYRSINKHLKSPEYIKKYCQMEEAPKREWQVNLKREPHRVIVIIDPETGEILKPILNEGDPDKVASLELTAGKGYFVFEARPKDDDLSISSCDIGRAYMNGSCGLQQDALNALLSYRKGADEKDPDAMYQLALCYMEGIAVPVNLEKARSLLEEIPEKTGRECHRLGVVEERLGHAEDALQWYEKAAEQEDPDALYVLSSLYREGTLVEQNPQKAAELRAQLLDTTYPEDKLEEASLYFFHPIRKNIAQAMESLEVSADLGDKNAQFILGYIYHYGKGVEQDYPQAMQWYLKAAEQGHMYAQYKLGELYYYGRGVEQDYRIAREWYERAAEQGDRGSQFRMGEIFHFGYGVRQDEEAAFVWLERSAKQGNADAQFGVGEAYYYGRGVAQDYRIALEWYQKAVQQRNTNAQFRMGELYYYGYGVNRNYQTAREWYQKAAGQGDDNAQLRMGELYYYGQGVDQSYQTAREWYEKSAQQNHSAALYRMGELYFFGYGVEKDYRTAREWYQKGVEQGNVNCRYWLGWLYYYGYGVEVDYRVAREWFQKPAEQGDKFAQYKMGELYYLGQGVEKNYLIAREWYQKAAEQDYDDAQYRMGDLYYYGRGVEQDYKAAFEWYQKAAGQGDADAQNKIGRLYEQGHGVERDYSRALEWHSKSAEQEHAPAMVDLANLYTNGQGVERDHAKAIALLEKAVELGNKTAVNNLGLLYARGTIVDYDKAFALISQASTEGRVMPISNLAWLYLNGYGVEKDYGKARELAMQSIEKGSYAAYTHLGDLYLNGWGVERDLDQAIAHYTTGSEHGVGRATKRLGELHETDQYGLRDPEKALRYFIRAREQGCWCDSEIEEKIAQLKAVTC